MKTIDSRGSLIEDGKKICIICARRPQRRNRKGKWLSYCAWCAAEVERQRRANAAAERKAGMTVRKQLTPDESNLITQIREAGWRPTELEIRRASAPAGRHHAGLSVDHYARCVRWCMWNWSFYLALLGVVMLTGAKFG